MAAEIPLPPPIASPTARHRAVRTFTRGEETANWITHGIGLLLSIAACVLLLVFACLRGDVWHVVSFAVYGLTLISLYASSTIYHALRGPARKALFKRLDHAAIYLLIAGTYTPFLLTELRSPLGWTLFAVIWALCGSGAVFKLVHGRTPPAVSTLAYVVAGWLILVVIGPLAAAVPRTCISLLVAGGVCYTSGIVFYIWHRLQYHHAIWHAFVLGGSTCHFLAVLLFLLPPAARHGESTMDRASAAASAPWIPACARSYAVIISSGFRFSGSAADSSSFSLAARASE
jgi:hemolysin III